MQSKDWAQYAQYIDATGGISKPWPLKLLQDQRATLDPETRLAELHQAWMHLGEWWQSQEAAVFVTEKPPGEKS